MLLDLSRRRFVVPELRNAQRSWVEREAVFVAVTCRETGVRGFGEASPLPGFSPESAADAEAWLIARQHDIPSFEEAAALLDPAAAAGSTYFGGAPPAARCALEAALLDGYCRSRGVSPVEVLKALRGKLTAAAATTGLRANMPSAATGVPTSPTEPGYATLLDVGGGDYLQQAIELSEAGYRTFKVKVGRELGSETLALTELASHFAHAARPLALRLDANRSLSATQLAGLTEVWRRLPIEYLEEPCSPSELSRLDPAAPLGFALGFDESLAEGPGPLEPWLVHGQVRALVFKPMYLGGASRCIAWSQVARKYGTSLVLSHLFDGPSAMAHYRDLAAALAPEVVAGLAPHPALSPFASAERAWREERGYELRDAIASNGAASLAAARPT